jgi:hypothetical protein
VSASDGSVPSPAHGRDDCDQQTLLVQPAHAVAKRAQRHVREQTLEVILAYDPQRAQEIEQATVEIGQRAIGIKTTTRPHDTNAVARSRARQSRPPEQE